MEPKRWFTLVFLAMLIVALLFFAAKEAGIVKMHKCETKRVLINTAPSNYSCQELGCQNRALLVGSKASNVYHLCTCPYAKRISRRNIICFRSIDEAEALGYKPCNLCLKSTPTNKS